MPPHQLVVDSTERVLALVRSTRADGEEEPERYYQQVGEIVDELVDTERFTRGVMAIYASARHYRALESDEEKARFQARIDRFGRILKHDLIYTYAKALLDFADERIETLISKMLADEGVRLPGERRAQHEAAGRAQGIHVADDLYQKIVALGEG